MTDDKAVDAEGAKAQREDEKDKALLPRPESFAGFDTVWNATGQSRISSEADRRAKAA